MMGKFQVDLSHICQSNKGKNENLADFNQFCLTAAMK